jgi:general stress protein 26
MVTLFASVVILAAAVTASAEPLPDDMKTALGKEKEVYVGTRRADGTASRAVPVWFWWDGKDLYFTTSPDSHKAKRIRRGSPVLISVNGADGPFTEGQAEIITDLDVVARMGEAYNEKYWIAWLGFFRPRPDRVADGKTIAVRVTFDPPPQ